MTTYYEYQLEKGLTVLVEGPDSEIEGFTPTSNAFGAIVRKSRKTFSGALKSVNAQAKKIVRSLEVLAADEMEVSFGLKTVGEMGNFAVGKLGMEINYQVTLKWISDKKPTKRIAKSR